MKKCAHFFVRKWFIRKLYLTGQKNTKIKKKLRKFPVLHRNVLKCPYFLKKSQNRPISPNFLNLRKKLRKFLY